MSDPPLPDNDQNSDPDTDPNDVALDYDAPETPGLAPPPPAAQPEAAASAGQRLLAN